MTEYRPATPAGDLRDDLQEQQRFLVRVTEQLDNSCARLEAATLSRLNSLRHQALDATFARRQRVLLPFGTLAGGCALLLVLAIFNGPVQPLPGAVPQPSLADIDLLSTEEDLDFYEDYEFIQWLAGSAE